MSTLSVIIPVYKVEPYLHECVDSVLGQTFQNLEVILIDDGSPDNCPGICDAYASKDSRIRVVHQTNQGLSAARNAGIELAHGDFIAFVDSDDFLSPDFCEVAMNTFCEHPGVDVVELPLLARFNTDDAHRYMPAKSEFTYGREGIFKAWLARRGYVYAYSQTKICRRELFRTLRFPVGKAFEDLHTTPRLLEESKGWAFISHPTANYFYRWRNESITGQAALPEISSQLEAMTYIALSCDNMHEVEEQEKQMLALAATNLLIDAARASGRKDRSEVKEQFLELRGFLMKHRPTLMQLTRLPASFHTKCKNLPFALLGLDFHLHCFA